MVLLQVLLELHSIYAIEISLNSIEVETIIPLIPSTTEGKRQKVTGNSDKFSTFILAFSDIFPLHTECFSVPCLEILLYSLNLLWRDNVIPFTMISSCILTQPNETLKLLKFF